MSEDPLNEAPVTPNPPITVACPARSPRAGLTLVEIVVATAVLSVLILGMFSALVGAQRFDTLARERKCASDEATRQLDILLANPTFSAIAGITSAFHVTYKTGNGEVNLEPAEASYYPLNTDLTSTTTVDESTMAGHIATSTLDATLGPNLCQIEVVVAWRAADGSNQRVELVSMREAWTQN